MRFIENRIAIVSTLLLRKSLLLLGLPFINFSFIYIYIYIYIYIVIHRQTVSFYQNSLVWLDTQDARSRNPSNFTLNKFQTSRPPSGPRWLREYLRYLFSNSSSVRLFTFFIPYRLPECSVLSKSFALCERRPTIPSPECSTPMGERIYCHPQTDCFVLSELFSVARHAGRLKPGSKPVQYIYIYIYILITRFSENDSIYCLSN